MFSSFRTSAPPPRTTSPRKSPRDPKNNTPAGTSKDGTFQSTGTVTMPRTGKTVNFIEIQYPGEKPGTAMNEKFLVTEKDAPALLAKVNGMKKNTPVTIKFTESLDGKWISDIQPGQAKPPDKKPADDGKPPAAGAGNSLADLQLGA